MDKNSLLEKLNKFSPKWLRKADPSLPVVDILQQTIQKVLPGLLHIQIELLDTEKIIGTVPYRHDTANVVGYMHGGTIFTAGDTLSGTFLWANGEPNQYAVTMRSEIKYLKPVKEGLLRCTVTEKSRRGKTVTLEAVFENEQNQTMALMTVDYALMYETI